MIGTRYLPDDFVLREVLAVTGETFDEFTREWGLFASHESPLATDLLLGPVPEASDADPIVLGQARLNISILQVLSRHYIAFSDGDTEALLKAWRDRVSPGPANEREAWERWEFHVNEALRSFPMHVRITVPNGEPIDEIQRRTTYAVAVLQLVQTATEGRTVQRCANEACGRRFTRQRSGRRRYEGTGHASGVKYCSRSCAKAQSERERRRRRRDESGRGV